MDHLLAAASFVEQIDLLKTNKEEWPDLITGGPSQQSEPSHEEVARVVTEAIVKEALRCAESPLISQSLGTSCPPNIGLSCRRNISAVEEGYVDPRHLLLNDNMTTARRSSARLASRAASPADDLTNSTSPSYQQSSGSTRKRKLAPAASDSSRSKKVSKSGSKHQRVKPQLGGDSSRPGLIVLKIQQWSNAPRSNAADQNAEDVEDFAPIKPRPLAFICSATPSRPIDVTPYSTPQQAIEVPHSNLESLSASRSRLQAMVQPHILDGMRYLAAHQPEKPLEWLSEFCRTRSEVVEGHWTSDEASSALVSMDANIEDHELAEEAGSSGPAAASSCSSQSPDTTSDRLVGDVVTDDPPALHTGSSPAPADTSSKRTPASHRHLAESERTPASHRHLADDQEPHHPTIGQLRPVLAETLDSVDATMVNISAAETALSADNLKHQTVPEDVVSSVVPADFPPHLDADARKSLRPIPDTGFQTMESDVFPSTESPAPPPRPPPSTPDVVDINDAEVPMQPLPVHAVASQLSQLPNDDPGTPTPSESALLEDSPLGTAQIEGAMQLHQAFGPEEPELASAANQHAAVGAVSASQDHGFEHLVPGIIEHLSEGATIEGTTCIDEVVASEMNAHRLAPLDTAYDDAPADADVWDELDEELFGPVQSIPPMQGNDHWFYST